MKLGRLFMLIGALSNAHAIYSLPFFGTSFVNPRPQTTNGVWDARRDMDFLYQQQIKRPSHIFDIFVSYAQSYQPGKITTILFGEPSVTVSGSDLPGRSSTDFLADQFALSQRFNSNNALQPTYSSVTIPASIVVDLSPFVCNAYFRLTVPFVWARSQVQFIEQIVEPGTETPFPPGYFALGPVTPLTSFTQALTRTVAVGALQEPLRFGRYCCQQTTKGLANITGDLGINIIADDEHSLGIFARVVTPNGTRPHNNCLFEPIIGNAHHWEFGFGLKGHRRLWYDGNAHEFDVYLALVCTHLFKSRQLRSFDLCQNGLFSRYLLAKVFNNDGDPTGTLVPLINYTTLPCEVQVAAQFDAVLMFTYISQGLHFDFGYNGYLRTKEKIRLQGELPINMFGIKGIQETYNVISGEPSSITEHTATIYGRPFDTQAAAADKPSPQFVNTQDLNVKSAASPLIVTNKLFTYVGYQWNEVRKHASIQPFLGLGLEIEFEGINQTAEAGASNNTLSQWLIQLRTGFLFG
jgi:hypothetical protein